MLICDVWDNHWSRGANERLAALLPTMANVVEIARAKAVHIIHAPSDTMDYYGDAPARLRMASIPRVALPPNLEIPDIPLPVDATDGGCDTGDTSYRACHSQHPAISIDQGRDFISDDGDEIASLVQRLGLAYVLILRSSDLFGDA